MTLWHGVPPDHEQAKRPLVELRTLQGKIRANMSDTSSEPIRAGFGRGLVKAGQLDNNVVARCADLTGSVKMDAFQKNSQTDSSKLALQSRI